MKQNNKTRVLYRYIQIPRFGKHLKDKEKMSYASIIGKQKDTRNNYRPPSTAHEKAIRTDFPQTAKTWLFDRCAI